MPRHELLKSLAGFSQKDLEKIEHDTEQLLPNLDLGQVVLVGGLAIRYHIAQAGIGYPQKDYHDLDFIGQDITVVRPTINQNFIISHYHPPTPDNNSFWVALRSRAENTHIDIFD